MSSKALKALYLIDVSYFLFRAYYALPPLKTSKGFPTQSLHGFLSMIFKLLREKKPEFMACCFDTKGPSFRADIFPEYKSHRKEIPEDLLMQFPYTKPLTQALGIPHFQRKSFEADDVIGSLAHYGKKNHLNVVIVSGDKDFAQLVDSRVSLLDTMKGIHYKEDEVKKKWGVFPHQMIDYLSLLGDASDNIPGVRGIGSKGAKKLLEEFKSLEGIYKNLDKISQKSLKKKLMEGKKSAYLSQTLVKIACDLDFSLSLEDLKIQTRKEEQFQSLLHELEFESLLKSLNKIEEKTILHKKTHTKETKKKNTKAVSRAFISKNLQVLSWTANETSENIKSYSQIWVFRHKDCLYIGLENRLISIEKKEWKKLGPLLKEKFFLWNGFDLKSLWRSMGLLDPLPPQVDLMLIDYALRGKSLKSSFEDTYKKYFPQKAETLKTAESFYLAHLELEEHFNEQLEKSEAKEIRDLLIEIDLPLVPVLYQMEKTGIYVDRESLKDQGESLEEEIQDLEKKIHQQAGVSFNIGSPKQLAHVLFELKGLPRAKKTKTGYSTDSSVLSKLRFYHPMVEDILDFRESLKLKNTYIDALLQLQEDKTGKIYSHFHQTATQTGRLSSTNPNLQNIPIRTKRGQMIRKAFKPSSKDHLFLSADYNQIELRVLAHLSEDPALLQAFKEDQDIHSATAMEIFNLSSLKEVKENSRRAAKAVNFGIVYGQGAFGLSESLGMSYDEASEIIQRYFDRFKRVREYTLEIVERAKRQGYVETLFGRKRYMEELSSNNINIRKFGERAAINAPIQGTASDIVKKAMLKIYDEIPAPLLLQVHDELLIECHKEEVEDLCFEVKTMMENISELKVNLKVNVGWGDSWDEAHA